jgi:O-antigen ligase
VSTKPRLTNDLAPFVKEAHDDYLAALVERGAVGCLGLFLLVCAVVARAKSIASSRLSPPFASVVIRPHALVGAVAGTLVAGTVYELLHVRHVWTLFAFLAALYAWGRE